MEAFKCLNLVHGSEDWQKARIGLFTASEISVLIGKDASKLTKGAKTYIENKACDFIHQETEHFSNDATDFGNEHEPSAVIEYCRQFKAWPLAGGFWCNTDCGASPDRLIGEHGLIEIKCPKVRRWHFRYCQMKTAADLKALKKEYYWQIQMQLLCTDRRWCDFLSHDPREDAKVKLFRLRIERNETDINKLVEALESAVKYKKELIKNFEKLT